MERSSDSAETENGHLDESSMISQTEAVEEPVISEESSMEESSEEPGPPEEIKITVEPHRFSGFSGTDQTPDIWVRSPLILTGEDIGTYPEVETLDYYYSTFDDFHRKLYEAFVQQISHTNEPDYHTDLAISADQLWTFADDFFIVLAALMDDHPELYRYDETYAITWSYDENQEYDAYGNRRVYLYQTKELPDFWEELEELDQAAEEILFDIDRNQSQYDISLQIHDKLIELVHFYPGPGTDLKNEICYSQTMYGALVDNGVEDHTCYCEGYADAYAYLMRRCGIQCIPIAGSAGTGTTREEAEANAIEGLHEWNLMKIDDVWYETDPTYDDFDPDTSEDYVQEVLSDHPEMLWGLQHYYFAIRPQDMYDRADNEPFVYYTDDSGQDYSLLWDHAVHIRASDPRVREKAGLLGDICCFLPEE